MVILGRRTEVLRAAADKLNAAHGTGPVTWTSADLGPEGVTANAVAPGYVEDTEFFGERGTPEFIAEQIGQTLTGSPGRRPGSRPPSAVRHLTSPQAAYVTGQVLHINGDAQFGR